MLLSACQKERQGVRSEAPFREDSKNFFVAQTLLKCKMEIRERLSSWTLWEAYRNSRVGKNAVPQSMIRSWSFSCASGGQPVTIACMLGFGQVA